MTPSSSAGHKLFTGARILRDRILHFVFALVCVVGWIVSIVGVVIFPSVFRPGEEPVSGVNAREK